VSDFNERESSGECMHSCIKCRYDMIKDQYLGASRERELKDNDWDAFLSSQLVKMKSTFCARSIVGLPETE